MTQELDTIPAETETPAKQKPSGRFAALLGLLAAVAALIVAFVVYLSLIHI